MAKLLKMPKSTIEEWVAEFGRRDKEMIAAAQRFELRVPGSAPDFRAAEDAVVR